MNFTCTVWRVVCFQYYNRPFPSSPQSLSLSGRVYVRSLCYEYQFSFILKWELITTTEISHWDSFWKRLRGTWKWYTGVLKEIYLIPSGIIMCLPFSPSTSRTKGKSVSKLLTVNKRLTKEVIKRYRKKEENTFKICNTQGPVVQSPIKLILDMWKF